MEVVADICSTSSILESKKKVSLLKLNDIVTDESNEAQDVFLSTVSHELKAPLTTIKGYVELLLRKEKLELETEKQFLESINQATDRLGQMINKLLTASWLEKGELKINSRSSDLREIWEYSILSMGPSINHFKLDNKITKGIEIWGDPGLLEQVCFNLLENAIKYSKRNSEISLGYRLDEGACTCWIKDNGIGIPRNALQKIFYQFYRAPRTIKEQISGSGLGLFIAEKIINAHNGKIWAQSKVGHGSTFYFKIPYPNVVDLFVENFG